MSGKDAKNSETIQPKSSANKLLIVIIILLVIIIGAGGFLAWKFIFSSDAKADPNQQLVEVHDDGTVDIAGNDSYLILSEDDKVDMDELQKKVDEGMMDLNFQNEIIIENGNQGTCKIANEDTNNHNMYVSLWLVETEKEIYRSGLIPIGSRIEQLELNQSLEVGEYQGLLVYNQLDDNNKIIGQVNVEVTLRVKS